MQVRIIRAFENSKATLGMLQIVGVEHDPIFTLENPWRNNLKDSSIPKGAYLCRPYSGTIFKNVYEIMNVHGRTAILFHSGNTEKDTSGCILLGLQAGSINKEPCVLHSRLAMDYFRKLIGQNEFNLEIAYIS